MFIEDQLAGLPERERVYFDSHTHTPLCKHAYGQPIAYGETGFRRGLKGHIVTCHSPMPDGFSPSVRMSMHEFDQYVALVEYSDEEIGPKFDIRLGMESDWFPGMEGWLEKLHASADFHYILGSVHPFLSEYTSRFFKGDTVEFQKQYFMHLAEAAESGLFDCLAHPDIVKVMTADNWRFDLLEETVANVLDRIQKTGVAMELNTSGLQKAYPEMNPGSKMLQMMADRDIPVVIGSDAHRARRVGEDFEFALEALRQEGYELVSYFDKRTRVEIPISTVEASLKPTLVSL